MKIDELRMEQHSRAQRAHMQGKRRLMPQAHPMMYENECKAGWDNAVSIPISESVFETF
jgi:hypothetical protein